MAMKTRCDHCDRMFGLKRYPDVCTQPREPQFCSKLCRDTYQDKWDRRKAHTKRLYDQQEMVNRILMAERKRI
jgi:hypothetical protein